MKFFRSYLWYVKGAPGQFPALEKVKSALFYLLIFLLPSGQRKILGQFTGGFDEYETIFLYASDIVLVLFLLFSFKDIWQFVLAHRKKIWFLSLSIFLALSLVSVNFATIPSLALSSFLRLALLVLFALGIGAGIHAGWFRLHVIFLLLIFLGVFEAVLGFSQFTLQRNVGLPLIGEPNLPGFITSLAPHISPAGIAKIDLGGGKLIRAYGTFPHPNVLAAFLLLALASLFYFWVSNIFDWKFFFRSGFMGALKKDFWLYVSRELLLGVGIFIISLGLLFTFSRTAWLIAAGLAVTFSVFAFFRPESRRQAVKLFFLCIALGCMLSIYFSVLVYPRTHVSLEEPAVTYRLRYDEVALDIIKKNPFGVGISHQVFYSVKNEVYENFGMRELWEWQPVHNIYMLMASEIGILGALAFIISIISLIATSIRRHIKRVGSDSFLRFTVYMSLVALLLFGLVDHFLWTLQPGRFMLWMAIGLVLGIYDRYSDT